MEGDQLGQGEPRGGVGGPLFFYLAEAEVASDVIVTLVDDGADAAALEERREGEDLRARHQPPLSSGRCESTGTSVLPPVACLLCERAAQRDTAGRATTPSLRDKTPSPRAS